MQPHAYRISRSLRVTARDRSALAGRPVSWQRLRDLDGYLVVFAEPTVTPRSSRDSGGLRTNRAPSGRNGSPARVGRVTCSPRLGRNAARQLGSVSPGRGTGGARGSATDELAGHGCGQEWASSVTCPAERQRAVFIAVARQGADVRRHRARAVPGRAWGARGGGVRAMPGVSPGQVTYRQRRWLACVFDFSAPSRIRTCAHGSGVQIRLQPLPAGTRPALHARGAYGARGIVVLSSAICRHRLP